MLVPPGHIGASELTVSSLRARQRARKVATLLSFTMRTELVYVPLDDEQLTALAQASEAAGCSVVKLVQQAVSEFLRAKRSN